MPIVRLATRRSLLATTQTNWVVAELNRLIPHLSIEIVEIVTTGDKILDRPLREVGGKSLFVKEIEQALLDGRADLAVHSLKDLPTVLPEGLELLAVPKRADPRDVVVAVEPLTSLDSLCPRARVGTSSLRRASLLRQQRPDVQIRPLRGNVDTRLRKLTDGDEFDAIMLAEAGLARLGREDVTRLKLDPRVIIPAGGQGALGIEARKGCQALDNIRGLFECPKTRLAVEAERSFLDVAEGSCQVPVGAFAWWDGPHLWLTACITDSDRDVIQRTHHIENTTTIEQAAELGRFVGQRVLLAGGATMLAEFLASDPSIGGCQKTQTPRFNEPGRPQRAARTQHTAVGAALRGRPGSDEPVVPALSVTGKRILVTRALSQSSALTTSLSSLGAIPVELPALEVCSLSAAARGPLDTALKSLNDYEWVIFTSSNGVHHTLERLDALGLDTGAFSNNHLACVGTKTAEVLTKHGLTPALIPDRFDAEGLLDKLRLQVTSSERVVVFRADHGRPVLMDGLRQVAARVDDIPAYSTQAPPSLPTGLERVLQEPLDLITVASPKTIQNLVRAAGRLADDLRLVPVACIGPVTRRAAAELGFDVVIQPEVFTVDGLVDAICEWFGL